MKEQPERSNPALPLPEHFTEVIRDHPEAALFFDHLAHHSPWTAEHSVRVGVIATQIGQRQQYGHDVPVVLARAAFLHDIGKIAVSTEILDKPTQLSPEESSIRDLHPRTGFDLLFPTDPLVAQIMVAHHEFQERRYPRKADRLPVSPLRRLQEIVAIADACDSLLSTRPYKPAWTTDETFAELTARFEPDIVEQAILARLAF